MKHVLLFDLDGTLLDTAADLIAALNHVRASEQLPPVPVSELRHLASRGARGLLGAGMDAADEEREAERLQGFLDYYAANHYVHTRLFDGIDRVLRHLREQQIPWGIVTNKAEWLTLPLLRTIGWDQLTPCIVCGDTTAKAKPDPLPVLHACELLGAEPGACWMIGDDPRDVMAGRDAGCRTAVAAWGYLGPDTDAAALGGDRILQQPLEILSLLTPAGEG